MDTRNISRHHDPYTNIAGPQDTQSTQIASQSSIGSHKPTSII